MFSHSVEIVQGDTSRYHRVNRRDVLMANIFARIFHWVWSIQLMGISSLSELGMRWVITRYYESYSMRFACVTKPAELAYRPVLLRLTQLPIKCLTKVCSRANPFDPT